MTKRYRAPDDGVLQIEGEARGRAHGVLKRVGVTVGVLFVGDVDDETGEVDRCLTVSGYPAAAKVKITPLEQRMFGVPDAVITVDEAAWQELEDEQRMALLDHELCHLQVRDADRGVLSVDDVGKLSGHPKRDDAGRPVLKMRKHDWQLGGFYEVARRHGANAIEVQDVRRHRDNNGQYYWDFASPREASRLLDTIAEHTVSAQHAQPGAEA